MKYRPPYISTKQSLLRFIISFIIGTAAAILLLILSRGPELGFLYDFLLTRRPEFPIAQEILIINTLPQGADQTENVLEPSAAASLILAITEFEASSLIVQVPVLGMTAGSSSREEDIRYHFNREFGLINRNITNFFDAIRTGSIRPAESFMFIRELTELNERGKERLINTLVIRDEEGLKRFETAAMIFGNVRQPRDLMVQVISTGETGRPGALAESGGYSRPLPDRDGVIRRIAPVRIMVDSVQEHIIYSALKPHSDNFYHYLDLNGALLFEIPRNNDFRRINMDLILKYDEENQNLRRLLSEAQSTGLLSHVQGEENPLFLYDYALALLDDLFEYPDTDKKMLWLRARNEYFSSLENFFLYDITGNIRQGDLYEKYLELLDLRISLSQALQNSFCILGPGFRAESTAFFNIIPASMLFPRLEQLLLSISNTFSIRNMVFKNLVSNQNLSDVEVSALLANSILTGHSIRPGEELLLLCGALFAAFLCAFLLRFKKPFSCLLLGFIISLIFCFGFSLWFIYTAVWLDPFIPFASAGIVTLISFVWVNVLRFSFKRKFRFSYGPFINSQGLKVLIRKGKPKPKDIIVKNAAIISIKNPELTLQEDMDKCNSAAAAVLSFQDSAALIFKNAGGIIAGNGGDLVLACFGSPLEHIVSKKDEIVLSDHSLKGAPVNRAAGFLADFIKSNDGRLWTFGLDFGLCAFSWSALSGYSVFGRPVVRSRFLANLNSRYHTQILVSDSVMEVLSDFPAKKLGSFRESEGVKSQPFYELKF